jgi:hypothetical protein
MAEAERARWSWASAAVLVLVAAGIAASVIVVRHYGGGNFWPGLVTGFIGTLVAFVLALTWEREQERRQVAKGEADLKERRTTEVRRRLATVRAELEKNAESLEQLEVDPDSIEVSGFVYLHHQLLDGGWTANAPRLSELLADYELVADLAAFYGRIEELRWRLRYRSELVSKALDKMTAPLVDELRAEVAGLLEGVARQIEQPSVQPLGLLHTSTLAATSTATATIETKVIRGNKSER